MGDYKESYSEASATYREVLVPVSDVERGRYDRSKAREALYGENWRRNPVNLNDVVERFAPGSMGHRKGVKIVFGGERYEVRADMPSGYLRVYDRMSKRYVMLDGTPSDDRGLTHFKILRREEM